MERDTLRVRAAQLVQKSRRALRLYSSRIHGVGSRRGANDPSERQLQEWRKVSADLVDSLAQFVENTSVPELADEIAVLAEQFRGRWRDAQAELHDQQRKLITAAERGDFVRSAQISEFLIGLKARVQACQAAYHEIDSVTGRSTRAPIEEPPPVHEEVEQPPVGGAKIIRLRREVGTR